MSRSRTHPRRSTRPLLALFALAWAQPASAHAPSGAYQVAQRAMSVSARLRAERGAAEAERVGREDAELGWWPQLSVSARYTRLSPFEQPSFGPFLAAPGVQRGLVPPGTQLVAVDGSFQAIVNNYMLQASVVLPVTDYVLRVQQEVGARAESERAARLKVQAARQRVARDAGLLFYGYAGAASAREVAQRHLADAKRQLAVVEALRAAGKGRRADVLSARARLANTQRLATQAALLAERFRRDLSALVGTPRRKTWPVPAALREPLKAMSLAPLDALLREAFARRKELQAYAAQDAASTRQSRALLARRLPHLDVFANAEYANPNTRWLPPQERWRGSWNAGVQLRWAPNEWAKVRNQSRQLDIQTSRLRAERQALLEAVRREVHEAARRVQQADADVDSTAAEVEAAEEALRVRREAYALGKETLNAVLDAQTALLAARLGRADAVLAQREARLALAFALGRDLSSPDSWPR